MDTRNSSQCNFEAFIMGGIIAYGEKGAVAKTKHSPAEASSFLPY